MKRADAVRVAIENIVRSGHAAGERDRAHR
jgi:hypothetical protein